MRILIFLLLPRFRKRRYYAPLAGLAGWFAQGIFNKLVFDTVFKLVGTSESGEMLEWLTNHPQFVFYIILGSSISAMLIWMYIDARREFTSNHLIDTLTKMHKRMGSLNKKKRLSQKIGMKEVDQAGPILMDKLGLVKLSNWGDFRKSIVKQVRRQIPQKARERSDWYYKVCSVTSDIKRDLVSSKDWTMDDLDKVGEWLDDRHWGLGELRDADKRWKALYESIRPFMLDDRLRELINNHISLSCGYYNIKVISSYSARWPNSLLLALLHSTLVGSPINPVKIDLALNEILSKIDKRMRVLQRSKKEYEKQKTKTLYP